MSCPWSQQYLAEALVRADSLKMLGEATVATATASTPPSPSSPWSERHPAERRAIGERAITLADAAIAEIVPLMVASPSPFAVGPGFSSAPVPVSAVASSFPPAPSFPPVPAPALPPPPAPTVASLPPGLVPGSHLPRVNDAKGRWQKEVNVPRNARVEPHPSRGGGSFFNFITAGNGALVSPGNSCTAGNCGCGHAPWVTSGVLSLPSCAVVCEVCGLFRQDFRINASNLRRHIKEKHVVVTGGTRDVNAKRLYTGVELLSRPTVSATVPVPAAAPLPPVFLPAPTTGAPTLPSLNGSN